MCEQCKKAYLHNPQPVNGLMLWPNSTKLLMEPPVHRRVPGRPKKARRKGKHEKIKTSKRVSKVGVQMTCSNCDQKGHNKSSCKNEPVVRPQTEVIANNKGKKAQNSRNEVGPSSVQSEVRKRHKIQGMRLELLMCQRGRRTKGMRTENTIRKEIQTPRIEGNEVNTSKSTKRKWKETAPAGCGTFYLQIEETFVKMP